MAQTTPGAAQTGPTPKFAALGQYLKDFSIENPNAPRSLAPRENTPAIDININVGGARLSPTDHEVTLKLEAKAGDGADMLFAIDLSYAGVFRIENVPDEQLAPFIMIEAPRFLFPFAREIVANATRQAGYPPLMIDPVDFVALFRQQMMNQQAAATA